VIGAFHYAFRRPFFAISLDPERAEREGLNIRLWDFLFYVSFGFVVTSSVSIAGVLLVFSYLVIPAVVAVLFAERIGARLAIGWVVGTLVSAIGVSISYFEDLPSGPVIVVCFGAFLVAAGVLHTWLRSERRAAAAWRIAAGAALFALLLGGSTLLRKREDLDIVHVLETGVKSERLVALLRVEAEPELWPRIAPVAGELLARADVEVRMKLLDLIAARGEASLLPQVHALLRAPDDVLREAALKTVRRLARAESVEPVLGAAAGEADEYLKVEMAETALELGDPRGVWPLLEVMAEGEAAQARRDAYEHLVAHLPSAATRYRAEDPPAERRAEVEELRRFVEEHPRELKLGVATGSAGG